MTQIQGVGGKGQSRNFKSHPLLTQNSEQHCISHQFISSYCISRTSGVHSAALNQVIATWFLTLLDGAHHLRPLHLYLVFHTHSRTLYRSKAPRDGSISCSVGHRNFFNATYSHPPLQILCSPGCFHRKHRANLIILNQLFGLKLLSSEG